MRRSVLVMSLLLLSCASDTTTGPGGETPEAADPVAGSFRIIDTDQRTFYDDQDVVAAPEIGEAFYGQDAGYQGAQPAYQDNGDGTVSDLVTGLMWQASPDLDNKVTFAEAVVAADTFGLASYDDWRLPTMRWLVFIL